MQFACGICTTQQDLKSGSGLGPDGSVERSLSRGARWWVDQAVDALALVTIIYTYAFMDLVPVFAGTIVATLLTPIGSSFNKSNQASYIGTSYLLSVCCFTPLYGSFRVLTGRFS